MSKTGNVSKTNKDYQESEKLSWENYKHGISVYACQSDTTHPRVLELAYQSGMITEERYTTLTTKVVGEKPLLDSLELRAILENYFGFHSGSYEEEECHAIQKTRMGGKQVAGEYRYMGEERTDNAWIATGLASEGACDECKYGSVVTMEERSGHEELCIDDITKGSRGGNRNAW